jgi:hypothetical protein
MRIIEKGILEVVSTGLTLSIVRYSKKHKKRNVSETGSVSVLR